MMQRRTAATVALAIDTRERSSALLQKLLLLSWASFRGCRSSSVASPQKAASGKSIGGYSKKVKLGIWLVDTQAVRHLGVQTPEHIDSATHRCAGPRDGSTIQAGRNFFGYPATIQKSFFSATILNESLRASGGGNSLGAKILATTKI
jgi:hypothetical protein